MLEKHYIEIMEKQLAFMDKLTAEQRALLIKNTSLRYQQVRVMDALDARIEGAHLILSGVLRVFLMSNEGREVTLYRLCAGDICMLRILTLLEYMDIRLHISVETRCETLTIASAALTQLRQENVYVENFMYHVGMERFVQVLQTIDRVLLMGGEKRLAYFLLEETQQMNSEILEMTHSQIARYVSSVREVITRQLKGFVEAGAVEVTRGRVKILDRDKLQEIVNR